MAFKNSQLSVIAYANGFTLWHYNTNDPIESIDKKYFLNASKMLGVGDVIYITSQDKTYQRQFISITKDEVIFSKVH